MKEEKLFVINSMLTKRPYIDEMRCAYAFCDLREAESFVGNAKDTQAAETAPVGENLFTECFAAGAQILKVKEQDKEELYVLKEEKLEKRFYNGALNANIARYLHTKNEEYIRAVRKCRMIVPTRIINEPHVAIKYAVVYKKNTSDYRFLAFTDIAEFDKWMVSQSEGEEKWIKAEKKDEKKLGWKPMMIDRNALIRIGKDHGYILDIFSSAFHISKKTLEKYIL